MLFNIESKQIEIISNTTAIANSYFIHNIHKVFFGGLGIIIAVNAAVQVNTYVWCLIAKAYDD